MSAAAILACGSACIASIALVTFTYTNLVALAMPVAVAVAGAQPGLANVTSVSFHALAHVVNTLTHREGAVLLTEGNFATQTTIAGFAKADAVGALAIAAACRWTQLDAVRAAVAGVAGALPVFALSFAIAIVRANLHAAIAAIKALEAGACRVDAHAAERAIVHAGCNSAVDAGEAGAAEACACFTNAIAAAVVRATWLAAVITSEALRARALEVGTVLFRCIASTVSAAVVRARLGGAIISTEALVALAATVNTLASIAARVGAGSDRAVPASEASRAHARAIRTAFTVTTAVIGAAPAVAAGPGVASKALALARR